MPEVKHLNPSQVELFKRMRTKFRRIPRSRRPRSATWDQRYAAQQAIHDIWLKAKALEEASKKVQEVRSRWAEKQAILDDSEKSLGPEANPGARRATGRATRSS